MEEVKTRLVKYGFTGEGEREIADLDPSMLLQFIDEFKDVVRFMTITCYEKDGSFYLEYHFSMGGRVLTLRVAVPEDRTVPSITPVLPSADWAEREIMDLFDLKFSNHPRPKKLIIREDAERGIYLNS